MIWYLMLMVASVFLGSKVLAISTPLAQLTLYRVLALGIIPLTLIHLKRGSQKLKIVSSSTATYGLAVYSIWWLWALMTVFWIINFKTYVQAMFLLTLGVIAIWSLYIYVNSMQDWYRLARVIWIMLTLLLVWGFFEILTNHYFLANMAKLDKNGTFASQPLTRMPITTFENQNDFGVLLLAYFPLNLIWAARSKSQWISLFYHGLSLLNVYLIYRTQSRMALITVALFFIVYGLSFLKWDLNGKKLLKVCLVGLVLGMITIFALPPLREKVSALIYLGGVGDISADGVRINLWRNGFIFLGQTLGLGVGAGQVESWMVEFGFLNTEVIVNMHNWWVEILVTYGPLVFAGYVSLYLLMIRSLWQTRTKQWNSHRIIHHSLLAFLIAFSVALVTSASNMLIEWHWVYFAFILAYIKLSEQAGGITPIESEE